MKILVLLSTVFANEPYQGVNIIAGYAAVNGAVFDGEIEMVENGNSETEFINTWLPYARDNGFEMMIAPIYMNAAKTTAATYNYSLGIVMIIPAGSNVYNEHIYPVSLFNHPFVTGAGAEFLQTGYSVGFYAEDPQAHIANVTHINQEGAIYNIQEVNRVSGGVLGIKLSGITDLAGIGITGHGVPITIEGLEGSTTLPAGLYYTQNEIDNNYFFINFETAGAFTIDSLGTVRFGSEDTTKALVQVDDYGLWNAGWGAYFAGVNGFTNNPNGIITIDEYVNADSFGTKFRITHTLGAVTGADVSGVVRVDTSSNSNPFIAGVAAFLKDNHPEWSWWDVRVALRHTASLADAYTIFNGYGKINPAAANAYSGPFTDDPYNMLDGEPVLAVYDDGFLPDIQFQVTGILNALQYDLYLRDELVQTYEVTAGNLMPYTLTRAFTNHKQYFRVKARRLNDVSEFSNIVNVPYYKYDGILVVPEAV